ncbi:phosphonate C-P lyase system protein PhnH [Xinfangfangia sp. D13-10-4-6]|uniref:phosphonate C-P lyase system protein PhnH n=1 Tax=Pseudogemmobacter hezensis TaxID=2737662 RepID=UPI001552CE06|nr:phosphonate C-P lyase system protein PhnH [Pseudogemmobacter hezensis]NPD14101.1 phosphonate C-P lyase system protein PhnH [Pseudogemmobacter hezensis]
MTLQSTIKPLESGGFSNPPQQSARAFRAIMQAMARPGQVEKISGATPPAPLSPAAGTLALVLLDQTTPLWLAPSHDTPELRAWLTFHTGAPFAPAHEALFAIGTWAALNPVDRFAIGTPEYPDRAATLIVELTALAQDGPRLTGPGIRHEAQLSLPEIAAFQANRQLYPLGFDTFFAAGEQIAGLPRSTIVEAR